MSTPTPTPDAAVSKPRAYVFFDGQNLFHDAQREFGCQTPDFCPFRLADAICRQQGWDLRHARFYTGVPRQEQSRTWSVFWANKGQAMKRLGVEFVTRKLSPKTTTIKLYDDVTVWRLDKTKYAGRFLFEDGTEVPDGVIVEAQLFGEKGIDVRIAVDMIRYRAENAYDVAVLFSRDKDLAEAVSEAVGDSSRAKGHGRERVPGGCPRRRGARSDSHSHRPGLLRPVP
jgi:uncharacterized LabA/DUF88 family protein